AVSHHRPRHRGHPDVDGHDDGAPRGRVAALQAGLLRDRRWLEPAGGRNGPELCPMSDTALVPASAPRPPAPRPMIRPERMPKPIEKAAMILTAIGPELGAGFLRELTETDMERFARAIAGLGKINQDILDAVIVEFLELLTTGPEVAGGAKAARKLLSAVLDDADEVDRLVEGRRRSTERAA